MFPSELQLNMQHQELIRAVEQQRLVKLALEGQPTLWQRIRSRLSLAAASTSQDDGRAAVRNVIALSR